MRILLDTNALLWAAYQPERLTSKAAKAYLSADELHFSIISAWEIALKLSREGLRGLPLPMDWQDQLIPGLLSQGIRQLPLELAHCRRVQDLQFHHKDPFDRMLVAQALVEKLVVIGADASFDAYGVKRIW